MRVLNTAQEAATWLHGLGVRHLVSDSRALQPGDAFVAWPGSQHDGRRFVDAALRAGALACLVEHEGAASWGWNDPRVAAVPGLKAAAGPLAHAFLAQPSQAVAVVAVTGTNGKTSTAWWVAQWLTAAGVDAAVIGTLGVGRVGHDFVATGLTTPDPVRLATALRHFHDEGVRVCAIEASSIGLQEHRLDGTRVHTAVFTNFTQDHLDYHGSMDAYWQAKSALFDWPGLQAAVINLDDPQGVVLAQALQAQAPRTGLPVWTVSVRDPAARLSVRALSWTTQGVAFSVVEGEERVRLKLPLVGAYNVSNVLCALAVLRVQGVSLAEAARTSAQLGAVPGRMQSAWPQAPAGLPLVLVDYAHTPDALEQALRALQPVASERAGRLWCVVGCGGDRDRSKRPLMAAAAEREAARLILTSDNPRSEDPYSILLDMQAGLSEPVRAVVEPDRASAIAQAVAQADAHDVILLAGKGHETYQEVAAERWAFSDVEHAQRALQQRANEQSDPGSAA